MKYVPDKRHKDLEAISHCLTAILQDAQTLSQTCLLKTGWQSGRCNGMLSILRVPEGAALTGGGSVGGGEAAARNLRGAGHASWPAGAGLVLQRRPLGRFPARLLQHDRAWQQ